MTNKNVEKLMSKEHKQFLDDLRESGAINMFGATPFLIEEFPELDRSDARSILVEWINGF